MPATVTAAKQEPPGAAVATSGCSIAAAALPDRWLKPWSRCSRLDDCHNLLLPGRRPAVAGVCQSPPDAAVAARPAGRWWMRHPPLSSRRRLLGSSRAHVRREARPGTPSGTAVVCTSVGALQAACGSCGAAYQPRGSAQWPWASSSRQLTSPATAGPAHAGCERPRARPVPTVQWVSTTSPSAGLRATCESTDHLSPRGC